MSSVGSEAGILDPVVKTVADFRENYDDGQDVEIKSTNSSSLLAGSLNDTYEECPLPKMQRNRSSIKDDLVLFKRRRSSIVREARANAKTVVLPCFDEEDDGVPPFCRHPNCPLDHRNPYLNQGSQEGGRADICVRFGNLGFPYFDSRRSITMGIATLTTILAILFTTFGCFSLSDDSSIVLWTYWVRAVAYNTTQGSPPSSLGNENAFIIYIGLTSLVQLECVPGTGCIETKETSFTWLHGDCEDKAGVDVFCDECKDMAIESMGTAFLSCVTLLFALMGCINRMRYSSDAPVQKLLGCVTDTWGALALTWGIYQFNNACYAQPPGLHEGYKIEYIHGPGITMYVFCAFSGYVRALLHWVTPLPGQGIGCRCELPIKAATQLFKRTEQLELLHQWQAHSKQKLEVSFNVARDKAREARMNAAAETSPMVSPLYADSESMTTQLTAETDEERNRARSWLPSLFTRPSHADSLAYYLRSTYDKQATLDNLEISGPTNCQHTMSVRAREASTSETPATELIRELALEEGLERMSYLQKPQSARVELEREDSLGAFGFTKKQRQSLLKGDGVISSQPRMSVNLFEEYPDQMTASSESRGSNPLAGSQDAKVFGRSGSRSAAASWSLTSIGEGGEDAL